MLSLIREAVINSAPHCDLANDQEAARQHHIDHAFVRELAAERREKRARRERIESSVMGWTVISALSGIGYAVWVAVKSALGVKTGSGPIE